MQNVAVYVRVSTEDQADRGTIEAQIEFATKYCDLHQYNIVDFYKDDGITGTLPLEDRPEADRLVQDAQRGIFDTILIYKLDRLGRTARIILNSVHELESYDMKVKSMTEPFDTSDPAGRFLLTILAGVADLERSNILDRMWHGANRAARNGKWLGGICPYGYNVDDDGYLAISDAPIPGFEMSEADVVRMIYRLTVDQGMSTIKIADYLNALGLPPKYVIAGRKIQKGKRKENTSGYWLPGRVRNMLVQTTYKGIHEYGKRSAKKREIIGREVPAIVTPEIWATAQETLHGNMMYSLRNAKRQYLLSGLIKCGTCGLNYSGRTHLVYKKVSDTSDDNQYRMYYNCNGKQPTRGPMRGKCNGGNISGAIEDDVWNDCVKFINEPDLIDQHINNANLNVADKALQYMESDIALIESSLQQKEAEKQSILDLYRKKLITSADVEKQLEKITSETVMLESRCTELKTSLTETSSSVQAQTGAKDLLRSLQNKIKKPGEITFEIKRNIIRQLVREIKVHTDYGPNGSRNIPIVNIAVQFAFQCNYTTHGHGFIELINKTRAG